MNKPGKVIEYIVPVNEGARNIDEMFVGVIRSHPKLIRCKDCKYYKVYELFNHTLPLCDRIKTTMAGALEEDDYCSRAERKEE